MISVLFVSGDRPARPIYMQCAYIRLHLFALHEHTHIRIPLDPLRPPMALCANIQSRQLAKRVTAMRTSVGRHISTADASELVILLHIQLTHGSKYMRVVYAPLHMTDQ